MHMPTSHTDNSVFWRQRAIQTLNDADQTADNAAKLLLLEKARLFEQLAMAGETMGGPNSKE